MKKEEKKQTWTCFQSFSCRGVLIREGGSGKFSKNSLLWGLLLVTLEKRSFSILYFFVLGSIESRFANILWCVRHSKEAILSLCKRNSYLDNAKTANITFPHKLDSVITILFSIGKLCQVPYCFNHWRKYIIRFRKRTMKHLL